MGIAVSHLRRCGSLNSKWCNIALHAIYLHNAKYRFPHKIGDERCGMWDKAPLLGPKGRFVAVTAGEGHTQ